MPSRSSIIQILTPTPPLKILPTSFVYFRHVRSWSYEEGLGHEFAAINSGTQSQWTPGADPRTVPSLRLQSALTSQGCQVVVCFHPPVGGVNRLLPRSSG